MGDSATMLPLEERLELKYVPINDVIYWSDNAKLHDIGGIITSIQKHGFLDPSKYDGTLGALVVGNGRAEALKLMQKQNMSVPRGVVIDKETGSWLMPILFGVDAKSLAAARRYAVDHNNLTMAGGDFTAIDMAKMWDKDGYNKILAMMVDDGEMPITLDLEDVSALLKLSEESELLDSDMDDSDDGEVDNNVITITFRNSSMADLIIASIGGMIDRNPQWEAQIKGR